MDMDEDFEIYIYIYESVKVILIKTASGEDCPVKMLLYFGSMDLLEYYGMSQDSQKFYGIKKAVGDI